jgi:predicted histidine transporter YuiF (NhaC family)
VATLAAVVIFVIASLRGGHFLYAASLLTFGIGLAGFVALPVPHGARWPRLFHLGLTVALAAALADGFLDLVNAIGTATNITTIGIIVGLALAFIGRHHSPAKP